MNLPLLQTASLLRDRIELLQPGPGFSQDEAICCQQAPLVRDLPPPGLERVSRSISSESSCDSSLGSEGSTSPRQLQRLLDAVEARVSQLEGNIHAAVRGRASTSTVSEEGPEAAASTTRERVPPVPSLRRAEAETNSLRSFLATLFRVAAASPSRRTRRALEIVARQFASEPGVFFDPVDEVGRTLLRPSSSLSVQQTKAPLRVARESTACSAPKNERCDDLPSKCADSTDKDATHSEGEGVPAAGESHDNSLPTTSAVVALLDLFNKHLGKTRQLLRRPRRCVPPWGLQRRRSLRANF